MTHEKLYDFYEKVYFAEIEMKDKLHGRVQTVFSLIVIAATVLTYLAKNTAFESDLPLACLVGTLTALSFILLLYSCWRLKKAFWGNAFKYCPSSADINTYHLGLIQFEKDFKDYCSTNSIPYNDEHNAEQGLTKFITTELINCSSWNSQQNEIRSSEIFESAKIFFISLVPLLIAVSIFLLADLDSASPRKTSTPNYLLVPLENIRRT